MAVVAKNKEAQAVVAVGEVATQTSGILFLIICMRISIKCICALRDRKPEKHFYTENCPKT